MFDTFREKLIVLRHRLPASPEAQIQRTIQQSARFGRLGPIGILSTLQEWMLSVDNLFVFRTGPSKSALQHTHILHDSNATCGIVRHHERFPPLILTERLCGSQWPGVVAALRLCSFASWGCIAVAGPGVAVRLRRSSAEIGEATPYCLGFTSCNCLSPRCNQ